MGLGICCVSMELKAGLSSSAAEKSWIFGTVYARIFMPGNEKSELDGFLFDLWVINVLNLFVFSIDFDSTRSE